MEFGKLIGVTATTVQNYERGSLPHAEVLLRIAWEFKKSVPWLLTGKELLEESGELGIVREPEEPYRRLGRSERGILKEVEEILLEADEETKRDLRRQVDLVRRARGLARARRVVGGD